jgi:hypothetical protein
MAEENPYKFPTAPVRDSSPPAPRSLTLAVLVGLAVGVGGTMLSRLVVGMVYFTVILERGASTAQYVEALPSPLSSIWIALVALGCMFSVLGGYAAARVARRHERRVTLVLAVLSTAIAFSTTFGGIGVFAMLVLTLTFVSVMAGGGLGRYRNLAEKRKTAAAILA